MSGPSQHRREQIEMHRAVADMYRGRARHRFAAEFQQERNDILIALAPAGAGGAALDLGCGTGLTLNHLAMRFDRVIGLDISKEMLRGYEGGHRAEARVALLLADMTALPIASGSVDVILCRSALHHMDDEAAALAEMGRTLKPSGRLVIGEPANDNPLFRLARFCARRLPSFGKIHTIDRAYTRRQLRSLLARAGLRVCREVRYGFIGYPLCDNPELVPVLKWLPAPLAACLGRALRALDRLLARIPLIRGLSWYVMLQAGRQEERPPARA
ncbi:MAG: class I SAM-dependent methyltransferase [Planctomycetes bacterium]|nr:class I SAM-dependent methyltransferase [Planctomycetota bacterium]